MELNIFLVLVIHKWSIGQLLDHKYYLKKGILEIFLRPLSSARLTMCVTGRQPGTICLPAFIEILLVHCFIRARGGGQNTIGEIVQDSKIVREQFFLKKLGHIETSQWNVFLLL